MKITCQTIFYKLRKSLSLGFYHHTLHLLWQGICWLALRINKERIWLPLQKSICQSQIISKSLNWKQNVFSMSEFRQHFSICWKYEPGFMQNCHWFKFGVHPSLTFFLWEGTPYNVLAHIIILWEVEEFADLACSLGSKTARDSLVCQTWNIHITCGRKSQYEIKLTDKYCKNSWV